MAENDISVKAFRIFLHDTSMFGIDLNVGDLSAGFGKPNRGVTSQGADLKDRLCANDLSLNCQ
jgi:hypothetical protein